MAYTERYTVIGRYVRGTELIGYQLRSNTGVIQRVTGDELCLMIGMGAILNCEASLCKDQVVIRGIGMPIESLPIIRVFGVVKENKDIPTEKAEIVASLTDGRNVVGYVVSFPNGDRKNLKRDDVIRLASDRMLSNAIINKSGEQRILRGVGRNLKDIPQISIRQNEINKVQENRGGHKMDELRAERENMIRALDNFRKAYCQVTEAWEQYNIDELADNSSYPFKRSFNELTIDGWCEEIIEQLRAKGK